MTEPPEKTKVARRLAAILAADIAGYSALMSANEEATVGDLKAHQAVVLPMIAQHGGRIIDTAGDGILAEFPSVVDAVECAVAIQRTMHERNTNVEAGRQMQYRIGINLGDIVYDETRIYGEGINIAARLESIAEPGGICLSGKVYEDIRGKVQLPYEDAGEHQLKNILHPVRVYRVHMAEPCQKALVLPVSDKPSIAVLPFANLSGDVEQEYFADGMAEEIITALSRIRWLFVIARNSSFTYKGRTVDIKRVGRELGVQYVLEGSVRKSGARIRIAAQLIDAVTGVHLWADRFDGMLEDVFDVQDKVASSVAGVIEPTLYAAEIRRASQRPTTDLSAYDLFLRAQADTDSWEKAGILRALNLLRQAVDRDPKYGSALALTALCHVNICVNRWVEDLGPVRAEGIALARRAVHASDDDPFVLSNSAYALGFFGQEIAPALELMERALELNPSYARGWVRSAWLRLWAGEHDVAIKHFEMFIRLSPREKRAGANFGIGVAHFFSGRLAEAKKLLLSCVQEISAWAPAYRFLASCYAHLGEIENARNTIGNLRRLTSDIIPTAEHWRRHEDRDFFLEGLRTAAAKPSSDLASKC